MNKAGFAIVGAAALALGACNNSNPDTVNNVEVNSNMTVNDTAVNDQAGAANAEAEALGNEANELQTEATANNAANNAANSVTSDNSAAEVNAM